MATSDISPAILREIRNQLVRIGGTNVIHDRELPEIYAWLRRMEMPGAIAHHLHEDRIRAEASRRNAY